MKKIKAIALAGGLVVAGAACDNDRGARKDLSNSNTELNEDQATVYLFPDQFPNLAHKCDATTGIWTTTDRGVWVVYDDVLCGGTQGGLVLTNIPGHKDGPMRGVTE